MPKIKIKKPKVVRNYDERKKKRKEKKNEKRFIYVDSDLLKMAKKKGKEAKQDKIDTQEKMHDKQIKGT